MGKLETSPVLAALALETIGDRESVTFRSISDARVPPGVTRFLFSRLLEALPGPGTGSESSPLTEALHRTSALEHQYERSEYLTSLSSAVEFLADYLVHPRASLLHWITGGRNDVSVQSIEKKLAAIHDYRYLPIVLSAWLTREGVRMVTREQLSSVISSIDDRVMQNHSPDELGLLARPIFAFNRFGGSLEVPTTVLREFYLEKGLSSFWEKVEEHLGPVVQSVPLGGLLSAIRLPAAKPVPTTFVEAAVVVPVEPPRPEIEAPVPPDQPAQVETAGLSPEPPKMQSWPLPDLASLISLDLKQMFVEKVFGRDLDFYKAVVASLNEIATWKEAALFLSKFYQANALDPFSDEVVEFTDIVHHRYDFVSRL
jgi:hypothetical protein